MYNFWNTSADRYFQELVKNQERLPQADHLRKSQRLEWRVLLDPASAEAACREKQRQYHPSASSRKVLKESALATVQSVLSPTLTSLPDEVMSYLSGGTLAASTTNAYALSWQDWLRYAEAQGIPTALPAPVEPLAAYLVARATRDEAEGLSFANTKRRFAAINHFHRLSNLSSPAESNPILRNIKAVTQKRLGSRGISKVALTRAHIIQFEQKFGSVHLGSSFTPADVHNLVYTFIFAVMFEACLRYDDVCAPTFSDVVWGTDCLRIFLTDTKTDSKKTGLWAFIIADEKLSAAYRLYIKILNIIYGSWLISPRGFKEKYFEECVLPYTEEFPIEIIHMSAQWRYFSFTEASGTFGAWLPTPASSVPYNTLLKTLKSWAEPLGFRQDDIGIHSLRRGGSSEDALLNLPDILTLQHGRWKSKATAAGYLETSAQIEARVKALRLNPHVYLLPK